MSPDPPGVAAPREPADGGDPTTASFRGGVEQVDETTVRPLRANAGTPPPSAAPARAHGGGGGRVRARKVRRIVRHIEPWSVLKISLLFFLALFLIICVASAVLWNAARSSGVIENVEDFITEVGGFGNCPTPTTPPSTTDSGVTDPSVPVDPAASSTTSTTVVEAATDARDCPDGAKLEGTFKFVDDKIFEAFALGGIVLVLAGSAGAVVAVLLFNLMSDLTGGVRVTVLEEEPTPRPARSSSPKRKARD